MSETPRNVFAQQYIERLGRVLTALPFDDIARAIEVLERAYVNEARIYLAGNGGSAATASHMCNDLVWSVARDGRRGFRAVSLADNTALLTAIANDASYDDVFALPLATLAAPRDVLIVFSGSGSSRNIVRAVEVAKERSLTTIGFLGMDGGVVGAMLDVAVIVPSSEYGPIEDAHMVFDHLVISYFKQYLAALPAVSPPR